MTELPYPFWLVWRAPPIRGNQVTHPIVRHATEESASDEARRLAVANPGCQFYVMESVIGYVGNVNVEQIP